ncbi:MAG: anti-sigma factor family protein [Bacteroidia bacterium]
MSENYSENQLLLYIYDEMDAEEKSAMEKELQVNPQLQKRLLEFKQNIKMLDELESEPSQSSIDIILEHARKLNNQELLAKA